MQRASKLAVAAYLVAAVLVLFPVFDVVAAAWPVRLGLVNWRYGAIGLFSRVLVTPLLGFLLASGVALALDQRRVLRALSVLNGVVAVLLIGVISLFMLDAVQLRAQAAETARTSLDAASMFALGKFSLALLIEVALAIGGWQASRSSAHARRAPKRASPPLMRKREPRSNPEDRTPVDRSVHSQTG